VVRVAVCQTLCIDSDREGNLRRIEYAVETATEQGAQLACFPETAVLGWINPDAHELADPIPGPTSDRIATLARKHELMISIGLCEKADEGLYDAAILVGADGRILLKHRKINTLVELLDPPYARGTPEEISAVETPIGRVGMLICADTFKEELVRRLAEQSPELVLVPYGWAAEKDEWPEHGQRLAAWVSSVARQTGCPVVGTDLVGLITAGPWKGKTYGGQSVVADRDGSALGVLRDRDVDVRVFELPVGRKPPAKSR
jgi:predicted amidohydrolase